MAPANLARDLERERPLRAASVHPLPLKLPARRRRRRMNGLEHAADLARQTVANIRRNKLRSFLTLFGIAWGIASLVLLTTLADGFREGQRKNLEQIGDRIVLVFPGRTSLHAGAERTGMRIFFTERDVTATREQCPAVETVAAERKTWRVPARSAFNLGQFLMRGATPEYLAIRNLALARAVTSGAKTSAKASGWPCWVTPCARNCLKSRATCSARPYTSTGTPTLS